MALSHLPGLSNSSITANYTGLSADTFRENLYSLLNSTHLLKTSRIFFTFTAE